MATDLYENDVVAWAQAQGAALRRRSANEIDWDNIAEEIETLGRSETRACESHIINILTHLLKIEFASLAQPVRHWQAEIMGFRNQLERDLTPSLRAALPSKVDALYPYAAKEIEREWFERNEPLPDVPERCPYTWNDVLGRGVGWLPEGPTSAK